MRSVKPPSVGEAAARGDQLAQLVLAYPPRMFALTYGSCTGQLREDLQPPAGALGIEPLDRPSHVTESAEGSGIRQVRPRSAVAAYTDRTFTPTDRDQMVTVGHQSGQSPVAAHRTADTVAATPQPTAVTTAIPAATPRSPAAASTTAMAHAAKPAATVHQR